MLTGSAAVSWIFIADRLRWHGRLVHSSIFGCLLTFDFTHGENQNLLDSTVQSMVFELLKWSGSWMWGCPRVLQL